MLGKGQQLKTTALSVFFLWLVKLEKLINDIIVDHLEKYDPFSDFQYGFRSSWSTADLLTVLSDVVARAFNRSGANWAAVVDILKAFKRVLHADLLHKIKSYGISGQAFGLISSFLSNRRLGVILDGKPSQEYPVSAGVPQGSIYAPTFFLLYINYLPDDFICDTGIYADDTTLNSKCDQATAWIGLWTWIWSARHWTGTRCGLLISMLGKLNCLCLAGLKTLALLKWKWMQSLGRNNTGSVKVKMNAVFFGKK